MSSGGLAEGDGVSNFVLQVGGDNVDNAVRAKGRHCPTDPGQGGRYFQHILYASHVTKSRKKEVRFTDETKPSKANRSWQKQTPASRSRLPRTGGQEHKHSRGNDTRA